MSEQVTRPVATVGEGGGLSEAEVERWLVDRERGGWQYAVERIVADREAAARAEGHAAGMLKASELDSTLHAAGRAQGQADVHAAVRAMVDNPAVVADLLDAIRAEIYNGADDPWQEVYDQCYAPQLEGMAHTLRRHATRRAARGQS